MRSKGFTLIELLVVIAIIAILAAILFPIFVTAKGSAQVTRCVNNLKQMGTALTLYTDDYSGKFPPTTTGWGRAVSSTQLTIMDYLRKYAKVSIGYNSTNSKEPYTSVGCFACPADTGLPLDWVTSIGYEKAPHPIWKQVGYSYEYFGQDQVDYIGVTSYGKNATVPMSGLAYNNTSTGVTLGAPMSAVTSPSKKAAIGCLWNWHQGEANGDQTHSCRNIVYADGHAGRIIFKDYIKARCFQLSTWH